MHLVINNQPPALEIEEIHVDEIFVFFAAIGQNLIGCDCDGFDIFKLAAVFAYLRWRKVCFIQDFIPPLAQGGNVSA